MNPFYYMEMTCLLDLTVYCDCFYYSLEESLGDQRKGSDGRYIRGEGNSKAEGGRWGKLSEPRTGAGASSTSTSW